MSGSDKLDDEEGWPVVPSERAAAVLNHTALHDADAFSAFFAVTVAISEAHEMGFQPPGARVDGEAAGTWTVDLPCGHGMARYTYTGKPPTVLDEVVMPNLD
ncbi:hypothetical protein OIU91_03725 [Streptomyces sp. NBC_01456]|uniref:hypothetical protein n=1 Tax=unclassified Streptomyces TaxID=2593676 RepID=UPI002E327CF4|nr:MULTISPECIES: hypothetical protein [unclassified Streptomyces]